MQNANCYQGCFPEIKIFPIGKERFSQGILCCSGFRQYDDDDDDVRVYQLDYIRKRYSLAVPLVKVNFLIYSWDVFS